GYDKAYENTVVSQSPRYGSLISEYKSGSIVVMGPSKIDESKQVPDFIEHSYSKAIDWAKRYNIPYKIEFDTDVEGKVGDVVKQTPEPGTSISYFSTGEKLRLVVKAGIQEIKFNSNGHGSAPDSWEVITGDDTRTFPWLDNVVEGGTTYMFQGWYTSAGSDGIRVYNTDEVSGNVTIYAHWTEQHDHQWATKTEATCTAGGLQECTYCHETRPTDPLGHDWQLIETVPATTESEGYYKYQCSRCGETYTEAIPKLEPEPVTDPAADCAANGGTWNGEACEVASP
nr:PASTA domain-containing protein [Erysipelotrichaceae bacterium]